MYLPPDLPFLPYYGLIFFSLTVPLPSHLSSSLPVLHQNEPVLFLRALPGSWLHAYDAHVHLWKAAMRQHTISHWSLFHTMAEPTEGWRHCKRRGRACVAGWWAESTLLGSQPLFNDVPALFPLACRCRHGSWVALQHGTHQRQTRLASLKAQE